MKLLNMVICTRNRENSLLELLSSIFKIPFFEEKIDIFIINDNSTVEYNKVNQLIKNYSNIKYLYNEEQKGKVKSILSYLNLFNGNYILTLDDKDIVINQKFFNNVFLELEKANNKIFIGYYQNIKNEIIGNIVADGETYGDFYFKKGQIGDHLFFIPNNIFSKFSIPNDLSDLVINDEIVYLRYIFNIPNYNFKSIIPLAIHDYSKGNLTKNIFINKINNWQVTRYCSNIILNLKNISLKIRIVKLFEIFLTRKKKKINFNKKINLLIYYFLYISGLFLVIKKIYLKKIKKLFN